MSFKITSPICSIKSIKPATRRPRLEAARPNKIENTTICRISLFAIACTIETGMMWSRMSVSRGAAAIGAAPVVLGGAGRPTPGLNSVTMKMPMSMEIKDANTNQASVLAPTRAMVAVPSMRATPTVSVANTSGAMIILIKCRNAVVTRERSAAALLAAGPLPSHSCSSKPNTGPVIIAISTYQVIRDFIGEFYHSCQRRLTSTGTFIRPGTPGT